MNRNYLAVDIGASSGRHFVGSRKYDNQFEFCEMYRFSNDIQERDGHLCWNLEELYENILNGMSECKKGSRIPFSMGIDTWGCDFVLLYENNRILGDTVSYRDSRTDGIPEKVNQIISYEDLYKRTGIQKQPFNTIYQLMSIKENNPELLEKAVSFLMIPDYFNFRLTGIKANEYTNATTTGLVNAVNKNWDYELIGKLGLPLKIFSYLLMPGSVLGAVSKSVEERTGYSCLVVEPCTHDTGSAVVALPGENQVHVRNINDGDKPERVQNDVAVQNDSRVYISSGTWSLLGSELINPVLNADSRKLNYTNEGGYEGRFRFLKNIMGLWMIQSVKKEMEAKAGKKITFEEIDVSARNADIDSIVQCNDNCFLAPKSMIEEIKNFCARTNQRIPESNGEIAAVIYKSLAACYATAVRELEQLLNCSFDSLNIIGGGSKSLLLNEMTEKATGLKILPGPAEATAIGNILVQMLCAKEFKSLDEARKAIKEYLSNGGK